MQLPGASADALGSLYVKGPLMCMRAHCLNRMAQLHFPDVYMRIFAAFYTFKDVKMRKITFLRTKEGKSRAIRHCIYIAVHDK